MTIAAAVLAFNTQLETWLDQGGDQRLKQFRPLNAWLEVMRRVGRRLAQEPEATRDRDLIAREIWRFQECPWDFDAPPEGMGELQKKLAIDQAENIREVLVANGRLGSLEP